MFPIEKNLNNTNYRYTRDDITTLLPNAGLDSRDNTLHIMQRNLVNFTDIAGNNDYFYQAMLDYLVACKGNPSENMRMVIPTSRDKDHYFNIMVDAKINTSLYKLINTDLGITKAEDFPKTREALQEKIDALKEPAKTYAPSSIKLLYLHVNAYTVDSNPLEGNALNQQNTQLHEAVKKVCPKATAPQILESVKQTKDVENGPLMVSNNRFLHMKEMNDVQHLLKENTDIKFIREAHARQIESEINEIIANKKEIDEIEARRAGSYKGNPPRGERSSTPEAVLPSNFFKEFFEDEKRGYIVNGNIARKDKIKIRYEEKDGQYKLIIEGGNSNKAVLEAALEYEIARQQKLGFDPVTLKFKCADEGSKKIFENYIDEAIKKGVNIKKPKPEDYEMQKGGKSAKAPAEDAMGGMNPAMMEQLMKMGK